MTGDTRKKKKQIKIVMVLVLLFTKVERFNVSAMWDLTQLNHNIDDLKYFFLKDNAKTKGIQFLRSP